MPTRLPVAMIQQNARGLTSAQVFVTRQRHGRVRIAAIEGSGSNEDRPAAQEPELLGSSPRPLPDAILAVMLDLSCSGPPKLWPR